MRVLVLKQFMQFGFNDLIDQNPVKSKSVSRALSKVPMGDLKGHSLSLK